MPAQNAVTVFTWREPMHALLPAQSSSTANNDTRVVHSAVLEVRRASGRRRVRASSLRACFNSSFFANWGRPWGRQGSVSVYADARRCASRHLGAFFLSSCCPSFFSSLVRNLFASIFDRFPTPTWLPESIKIHQKSMPRCTSCCMRFLVDF